MTRKINPMEFFTIPELKPERTAKEIYLNHYGDKLVPWTEYENRMNHIGQELKRGTEHELEHTPFRYIARIIASHHVYEDLAYYKKLERWHK